MVANSAVHGSEHEKFSAQLREIAMGMHKCGKRSPVEKCYCKGSLGETISTLHDAAAEIQRLCLVVEAADDFYYAWAHQEGQEESVGTLATAYWNARKAVTEVEL